MKCNGSDLRGEATGTMGKERAHALHLLVYCLTSAEHIFRIRPTMNPVFIQHS